MSRSRSKLVLVGYGLVVGVLGLNAWLTVANLRTIRGSVRWVDHTWTVLNELEHVQVLLGDVQASKRGYLLTTDAEQLALLHKAEAGLRGSIDRLARLTTDSRDQGENVASLRSLAEEALREHHRAVEVRDRQGLDAAILLVRDGPSTSLIQRARALAARMERHERGLLAMRANRAEASLSLTTTSFAVATAVALVLLGGVIVLERRERIGRILGAEALRRSDTRLRLAVEATSLGTWDLDVATGLLDWSDRCKAIFGLSPEADIDYAMFLRQVHPEDRAAVDETVRRALRGDDFGDFEAEYRIVGLPDHTERWVSARGRAAFDERGQARRMIGTVLDVTDRKRAEQDLRAARDQAEAASRAKSQFLAVLSHELRTPLNPALLEVTALLDQPETPGSVRHSLEIVHRCIELESRLVDDLLDLVRIVQGKLRLFPATVDVHETIRATVAVVAEPLRARGLRLRLDLAAPRHHVEADGARLQQVLWNLAANALKFTPVGGTIAVRTRQEGADRLVVEVQDDGDGIAPEVLDQIFDPFQQGETTVLRRHGGLGLGLAISRGLIEAHRGKLTAESAGPGLGSTFRIELPTVPSPEPANRRVDDEPTPDESPRRILLVEDDPDTLHVMTRLLGSLGHEVATASTLAAALDLIGDSCPFDLILSDIGLPDGSGLELMRLVAACGETPAVAFSGLGMREDVARSLEAGFRAHFTKPIDFARLKRVIADLGRAQAPSPGPPPPGAFPGPNLMADPLDAGILPDPLENHGTKE